MSSVEGTAESQILAALDRGEDRLALELMMTAYGAAIYRFCRHMVADPVAADDAHQITFIQAFEDLATFSRRSSVQTWLFAIARHRCLDLLKSGRRRKARFTPLPESGDCHEEMSVRDPAPDERLILETRAHQLLACLGRLRAKSRAAILLRFQGGLSYPEMANASSEQPATLQARVARAMPVLRRCLESRGLTS